MHFIVDYRATSVAENLSALGEVTLFDAGKLVYPAIGGHPDIFLANIHGVWVLAPNTPAEIKAVFEKLGLPVIAGTEPVGFRYPFTAFYNVFADDEVAVISRHTNESVLLHIRSDELITVKQGYIACNLARIGKEFITTDTAIAKELEDRKKTVHFVKPDFIRLAGVPNGFIGGTVGQIDDTVYFAGSIRSEYAPILQQICKRQRKELIFTGRGEALDVGGIVIVRSEP